MRLIMLATIQVLLQLTILSMVQESPPFQHPDGNSRGTDRTRTSSPFAVKATKRLPESYTIVTHVPAITTDCTLPTVQENFVDYEL